MKTASEPTPTPVLTCFVFTANVAALAPRRELSPGHYKVLLRLYDAGMLYQDSTLDVEVCRCQGAVSTCFIPHSAAPRLSLAPSVLTSTLGAVFCLLCTCPDSRFTHMKEFSIRWSCFHCKFFVLDRSAALTVAPVAEEEEEEVGEGGCSL